MAKLKNATRAIVAATLVPNATFAQALDVFKEQVIVGSRGLVLMCAAAANALILGDHLAAEGAKDFDGSAKKLEAIIQQVSAGKSESRIRVYIGTAKAVYRKIVELNKTGGVMTDIAKAKDATASFAAVMDYLESKGVVNYDKLQTFLGRATTNQPEKKSPAEKATTAIVNTFKSEPVKGNARTRVAVAKAIGNAVAIESAETVITTAFSRFAVTDPEGAARLVKALDAIVTEALKVTAKQDKAAKATEAEVRAFNKGGKARIAAAAKA